MFRRRLVEVPFRLGHPVWVDDPGFDIDYHVRRAAVPKPGGLRELADLTGEITGHQLDRARPLWEMWIIEGLADDNIGFVAKMHHSTVDGVSGAELLSVLFDLDPDPELQVERPESPVDERIPSGLELMAQAAVARSMRPFEMTRDIVRTGHRVLNVRKVRIGAPDRSDRSKAALPLSAPRTSFNTALTWRRSVTLTAIGLADVKRVKNATGTTVNDVILAVCTGAMRTFLLDGDELPDKPLVAVVPVSVRPDIGSPRGSNQLSTMFVHLPTNLDGPIDRLMAIHEGTKGAKEEHNALGADTLQSWTEHATPNVFASGARLYSAMRLANRHRPIANLVISNVPGSGLPAVPGRCRAEGRLPARTGHGGDGTQHHRDELPGRPLLGDHGLSGLHPRPLEPDRGHPTGPRRAPRCRRRVTGHLPVGGRGRGCQGIGTRRRGARHLNPAVPGGAPAPTPVTEPGPPPSTMPRSTPRSAVRTSGTRVGTG